MPYLLYRLIEFLSPTFSGLRPSTPRPWLSGLRPLGLGSSPFRLGPSTLILGPSALDPYNPRSRAFGSTPRSPGLRPLDARAFGPSFSGPSGLQPWLSGPLGHSTSGLRPSVLGPSALRILRPSVSGLRPSSLEPSALDPRPWQFTTLGLGHRP